MKHPSPWLFPALVPLLSGCASLQAARPGHTPTSGSSVPPVRFVDVTAQAGIHFRHVNGATGRYSLPETMGSGAAFLDYDGDGWLDLFLVNSGPLRGDRTTPPAAHALYHNNRDGTFADVTKMAGLDVSLYGMGVCAGDYDNDGRTDLYLTAAFGPSRLFHNNGNGTFTDVTKAAGVGNEGQWGTSCAWLDYDNDGRLDLFVCNYMRYDPDRERVCHQGDLRTYCGPLVYTGESCRLYRNLGEGRFRDVSRAAGIYQTTGKSLGVAVWDFDGDHYPEIMVANDLTPNCLFRNNRNGTFSEIGLEAGVAYGGDGTARSGMGIDVADTRNDGKCQVLVSNYAREPNSFFCLDGSYPFTDRTYETGMGEASLQSLGFGLFFFDYDNDTWKDALVVNGHIQPDIHRFEAPQTHAQRPLLFRNRRDGTFAEAGAELGGPLLEAEVGRGAACADYDNDGDQDAVIASNGGSARLLRNDGGNRLSWLTVRLTGKKCNRDGLGAEVRVRAGGQVLRDQARSGSSYLSASDPRLHFGLGANSEAEDVEVRWPDGAVQHLPHVQANQILQITEGEAPH